MLDRMAARYRSCDDALRGRRSERTSWTGRTVIRWFGLLLPDGAALPAIRRLAPQWGTAAAQRARTRCDRPSKGRIARSPTALEGPETGIARRPGKRLRGDQRSRDRPGHGGRQGTDYRPSGRTRTLRSTPPTLGTGTGRVGIAGHRATYLHPFFNLDQVLPGDTIELLTGLRHLRVRGEERTPARSDGGASSCADQPTDARPHHLQPAVRELRAA